MGVFVGCASSQDIGKDKYYPSAVEVVKEHKVLIASGKVKVYAVFSEID